MQQLNQTLQGLGLTEQDLAGALQKALTSDSGIIAAGDTGSKTLRLQVMDSVLKSATLEANDCVLWQQFPKNNVASNVYEFTRRQNYGAGWGSAFIAETGTGQEMDAAYKREVINLKYAAVTKQVSLVLQRARTLEEANAIAMADATNYLLQNLDAATIDGNSAVNALEFDGIDKIITDWSANDGYADIVVDLAGERLTLETLYEVDSIVRKHGGYMDTVVLSPDVMADLAAGLTGKYMIPQGSRDATGLDVKNTYVQTVTGMRETVKFYNDPLSRLLRIGMTAPTAADTGAPVAPATVTGTAAAGGSLAAGDYTYKVTSVGPAGQSIGTASAAVTATANQKITLAIADPGSGTMPIFFAVYRTPVNAATPFEYLGRVIRDTDGNTAFVDTGGVTPGLARVYGLSSKGPQGKEIEYVTLGGMFRRELANLLMADQFGLLVFLSLGIYSPGRHILIKNVDTAAHGAT